jgi:hypothetical protein
MEGIWYAHFIAGTNQGDGLAVLRNGEILGGDAQHIYKGSYQEDGRFLYANVRVAPSAVSPVPADLEHPFSLFLKGSIAGTTATISGHPDNHPDVTVQVELRKGD